MAEIFLVGIDSGCFETYFKTKISTSKIFFQKMPKIVKKWQSQTILAEKTDHINFHRVHLGQIPSFLELAIRNHSVKRTHQPQK